MANLMITTACNFTCDYCFGLDMIGPTHPKSHMTYETFMALLDWIEQGADARMDIHLMGGEPTLNPRFPDMARAIVRRGRRAVVFSNAATAISEDTIRETIDLGVRWIVNCNRPDSYIGDQMERLRQHLAVLGENGVVTLNITSDDTPYEYVFEYIEEYGLCPSIKLGVALPTYDQVNLHATRKDLPGIANRIMELYRKAQAKGIDMEFECGVAYCLFTPEQHAELKDIMVSHCGSRLDITPAGDVINCLPLCKVASIHYTKFPDYGVARQWFADMQAPYKQVGSMAECLACTDRLEGKCSCCLAYGLSEYSEIVLPPLPGEEAAEMSSGTA